VSFSSRLVFAQAEAIFAVISGQTVDQSNAALPGVTLTARNVATGFTRSTTSDGEGRYRLLQLPVGTYEVTAELSGFATVKQQSITLTVGQEQSLNLTLKVAAVSEQVTVTAAPPVVETARTSAAVTVDVNLLENFPINGRRFNELVTTTPGTMVESQRSGVSIAGQRGINSNFSIDGADFNNPFFGGIRGGERAPVAYTISQDAIQEFQVVRSGYSAEYGRSGGGLVNAITRSGTNQLRGSVFEYYRNQNFVADDALGRKQTEFRQHQFGTALGGPIVRDRLHFFTTYDQQVRDNPIFVTFGSATNPITDPTVLATLPGTPGTFKQTNNIWTWLGKADWQVNEASRLSTRYNFSYNKGENGQGGATQTADISNNGLEEDTTHTVVSTLSSTIGSRHLNELRFQYAYEDRPRTPNDPVGPNIQVTGVGFFGRTSFLPSLETDKRTQIFDSFTTVLGEHTLKTGADFNIVRVEQPYFLSNAGGVYIFPTLAAFQSRNYSQFRQGFGAPDFDGTQNEYAIFVQDTWRPTNYLTLDGGLRWEAQVEPDPPVPNPAYPQTAVIPDDKNNFGPRGGIAWDVTRDTRTVVRGGAGLFFSRTPALLLVSAFNTNGIRQLQYNISPTASGAPKYPSVLSAPPVGLAASRPDVFFFQDGFQNPQTLQANLGVEREIHANLTAGVDYVYARARHLERLRDVNLLPPASDATGRAVFPTTKVNPTYGRVLQVEDSARSDYHAVTTFVSQRLSRGIQFRAFYTWSRTRDDDSNERNFSGIQYQNAYDLAAEYGPSATDIPHSFNASGAFNIPYGVVVGITFNAQSGTPINPLATGRDLNNDSNVGNDRVYINGIDPGRNSFRTPAYRSLNIRLTKSVRLSGTAAAEIALDVFNLLNGDNFNVLSPNTNALASTDVNGTLQNPDFNKPNGPGAPRQAQIAVRFKF
jgi:hypothetical protein